MGSVAGAACTANTRSVRDQLLRWYFRQAELANVRATEAVFEVDFTGDMMGEIRNGPKAAERMEFELFSCLVGYSQR